jgi:cell fate (sporulation/competence/biofilm development) regulator YlbF (YheA/YmcA/DUF963 family)
MNVHDKAYELARILSSCDEYQGFLKAKNLLETDEQAKKMVKDFLAKQMAYEYEKMSGKSATDQEQQLQKLAGLLALNPIAAQFLQAHLRFQQVMADLYKIIGDSIAEGMDIFGK